MKNITLYLIKIFAMRIVRLFTLLFTLGCSSDTREIQSDSLTGTWQLISVYESSGGATPTWQPIEDGFTLSFQRNNVFVSSKFECDGLYEINPNQTLTINFDCETSQMKGELDYRFVEEHLILTPNPNTCIEGCDQKFKKIAE